ncbi:MAG: hypothetical protein E7423_07800 [Ruminococcaceae bacterium]|nr:hypothetical protein [Oscillospiraceae bacterium]
MPSNLFSVVAVDGDFVTYLSIDDNDNTYLYRYDVRKGESLQICELENYLMNPANCAEIDGILYLNYITRDNRHIFVAADINNLSKEELTAEDGVSGLVYSAATSDKAFSLKHTNNGISIVDCYSLQSKDCSCFISFENGQTAYGISAYGENIYILLKGLDGVFIKQYDSNGKEISQWDISFAEYLLEETQISSFQIMNDHFYLCNFSGESAVFDFEGQILEGLVDSTITKTPSNSFEQYSFYNETNSQVFIFDTANSTLRKAYFDIPTNHVIRYVYSDYRNPSRALISIKQIESGDEKVFVGIIE